MKREIKIDLVESILRTILEMKGESVVRCHAIIPPTGMPNCKSYSSSYGAKMHFFSIVLKDFIELIESGGKAESGVLISLSAFLLDDIDFSSIIKALRWEFCKDYSPYLWCGLKGKVVPFHRDNSKGVLIQVVGAKKVRIINSEYTSIVQSYPDNWQLALPDSVDEIINDESKGSNRFSEFLLLPGQALMIPEGIWHEVTYIDNGISYNLWPDNYLQELQMKNKAIENGS